MAQSVFAQSAAAPTDDAAALSLDSAAVESNDGRSGTKLSVEGAVGIARQRDAGMGNLRRASVDFTHSIALAPGWRAAISDRLDYVEPAAFGADAAVNSLREAYVSWQNEGNTTLFEVGRVNLRYGPGYGYNPTDFFRDSALRVVTSTNPLSLRENRLGTFMLRGQYLWTGGSLSAAFAPKLADKPSSEGFSVDLGATNNRDRGLVVLSQQASDRVSAQLLVYKESESTAQLGANVTALLTDATVAHAEWSRGREPDLLGRAGLSQPTAASRNRFAGGLTYTTSSKLSVTAEYHHNGFALNRSAWDSLRTSASPAPLVYLVEARRRQELASRRGFLVYATQKGVGLASMDLAALVRLNLEDRSKLGWIELRNHWRRFDLALQLQVHTGDSVSEFGVIPDRKTVQVVATYYFE